MAIRADGATMLVHFNSGGFTADVRLENRCSKLEIKYKQKGTTEGHRTVLPGQQVLYTRDEVTGLEELEWFVNERNMEPQTQPFGSFGLRFASYGDGVVFVVTFPDGPQKVILFCDSDLAVGIAKASAVKSGGREEASKNVPSLSTGVGTHFTLALRSICISLLASGPLEVATLSLQDKIAWEFMLPKSDGWGEDWMRFGRADQAKLELAFSSNSVQPIKVDQNKHVNLADMTLVLGSGVSTVVRRHHHPAIRATYVDAADYTIIRLLLEHMQIDNQLPDPFVPVILAPAKPSRSSQPQLPFLKVLMILGKSENKAASLMVERCSVLLQKMTVSVTERFLLRLADLAPGVAIMEAVESVQVALDTEQALKPLYSNEDRISMVASSLVGVRASKNATNVPVP